MYGQNSNEHFKRRPYIINNLRRRSMLNPPDDKILTTQVSGSVSDPETSDMTHKGCRQYFCMYLKSYGDMASLHGLQYFVERSRPIYERCFWLFAVALVIFGMVYTIKSQIHGYIKNPIVMSLSGKVTPVFDVPFPAITFCSDNQVPVSVINISQILEILETRNLTRKELSQVKTASILCSDSNSDERKYNLQRIVQFKSTFSGSALLFATKMCQLNVKQINWQNEKLENPCSWMQITTTYFGLCHSFNSLPYLSFYSKFMQTKAAESLSADSLTSYEYRYFGYQSHWSPDTGFNDDEDDVLLRLPGGAFMNNVFFLLDFLDDQKQEACMPRSNGFYVTVHNPGESPRTQHSVTYVEVDERAILQITPKLVTTDESLRSWKPEDRGCYYNHERPLMFFNLYTSLNCDAECESNITFAQCKCNTLAQPSLPMTPVCEKEQLPCVAKSVAESESVRKDNREALFSACNCLPACNELSYDIKVTRQPRNWTYNSMNEYAIPPNETKVNSYATVIAAYRSQRVNAINRFAITSTTDFIANVGGLMGLFMGFSFISIFEIVYFSSIRWISDLWKRNKWIKNSSRVHNKNSNGKDALRKIFVKRHSPITDKIAPRTALRSQWQAPLSNNKNASNTLFFN